MEVEFKVEGAVIRGDIMRAGMAGDFKLGPGVILTHSGEDDMVANYQKALALNEKWEADVAQVTDALDRHRKIPAFAEVIARIEQLSRGSVNLQRRLMLDYRMIGEPYLTYIELRELANGRLQWALTGTPWLTPVRQIRATGIWLPDESIYEEMEDLARAYTAGSIEATESGAYQARLTTGCVRIFDNKSFARCWLFKEARKWLSDFDADMQASSMTRAAWDMASEALDRMNAIINHETYKAVVTVVDRSGLREEHTHEGLIGMDEALVAMRGLLEQVHPTAFPMPRLH